MNNINKNNSSLPLAIIGLVLLAALAGGWYWYQNSKKPATKAKAEQPLKSSTPVTSNLPGAQPPNMLGSPNATVTIEEFADFQCPTCAAVHSRMKEINAHYGSRVKFIYRSFPLTQIHRNGYDAAVAAEAAGMQGRYWDMQNQLFSNQQVWANADDARRYFNEYAQKIGLDVNRFQTDMLGMATKGRVDADMQRGRALNVQGTPTIFVNGKALTIDQFDVTTMRQLIDAELQKAQNGGTQTTTNQTTTVNPAAGVAKSGDAAIKDASNSNEKK
jgi:protein-disulfide isomerase